MQQTPLPLSDFSNSYVKIPSLASSHGYFYCNWSSECYSGSWHFCFGHWPSGEHHQILPYKRRNGDAEGKLLHLSVFFLLL